MFEIQYIELYSKFRIVIISMGIKLFKNSFANPDVNLKVKRELDDVTLT